MRRSSWLAMIGVVVAFSGAAFCKADEPASKKKVLFFSLSCGFQHSTVTRPKDKPNELSFAENMIKEFGQKAGYDVSVSQDSKDLQTDEQFNKYDCIIFYTTGNPDINRDAFVKWLQSGKAFVGIHCATDTYEHEGKADPGRCGAKAWPDYTRIIGGAFKTHKVQQEVTLKVEDKKHRATRHLGDEWTIKDEIYQFQEKTFSKERIHPLLSIDNDKTDLKPQEMEKDKYYGVSWTNTEGKGRVFYTSLGHREDVWTNPKYQEHLMGGIAWALHTKPAK